MLNSVRKTARKIKFLSSYSGHRIRVFELTHNFQTKSRPLPNMKKVMRTKWCGNRATVKDWPGLCVLYSEFCTWAPICRLHSLYCFVCAQNIALFVTFYQYWLHSLLNTANSNSEPPIIDHLNLELISQTSKILIEM